MKGKRYRVEAQAQDLNTWEPTFYTNDLAEAQRYAAGMVNTPAIRATRVIDQESGEEVDSGTTKNPR